MNSIIPKIIMLISGERIIAGVREITGEDGKGICIVLKCPYVLNITPVETSSELEQLQYSVNFSKWQPYSANQTFNIPYFSIITVCEVDTKILNIYLEKFGDELNDDDTLPTVDPSDIAEGSEVLNIGN